MAKGRRLWDDVDSPWKDALHYYLPDFLAFFFADIHADIDWSRGFQPLDKEFQQIVRRAKVGKLIADKLFKVWLRDGTEHWLLIHVEIQGEPEEAFPERMFNYNSAVRKLHNQEVISLAVLCDDRPAWKPTSFAYGRWGCRMELTFRIAKVLDYSGASAALEASTNPFAAVVSAHLETMATRDDPAARRVAKLRLVKRLYVGNHSKEDVRRLFGLVDWLMTLPDDLEEAFRDDVFKYEEEQHVEYMSSIERYGFKKGEEMGERNGLLEGIALDLETRFGVAGRRLLKKARALPGAEDLRKFARFLKTAQNIRDVRTYLG